MGWWGDSDTPRHAHSLITRRAGWNGIYTLGSLDSATNTSRVRAGGHDSQEPNPSNTQRSVGPSAGPRLDAGQQPATAGGTLPGPGQAAPCLHLTQALAH